MTSYQKAQVWKLAWHWVHPAVPTSTLKRNSKITQSQQKGIKKGTILRKVIKQSALLIQWTKRGHVNLFVLQRPFPYLDVASLSSMSLTPASRVEGGAASLGASAVPDPSTTIIFLIPAWVTGGRNRALSLPTPAFHWLGACSKIKADGYDNVAVISLDLLYWKNSKPLSNWKMWNVTLFETQHHVSQWQRASTTQKLEYFTFVFLFLPGLTELDEGVPQPDTLPGSSRSPQPVAASDAWPQVAVPLSTDCAPPPHMAEPGDRWNWTLPFRV